MMFEQPPGGDGNDPNKPNELPTTPTLDRGSRSHKTPGAPKNLIQNVIALHLQSKMTLILTLLWEIWES